MPRPKHIAVRPTTLKYSISDTETSITLSELVDTRGNAIVMADFGTYAYCGIAPKTNTEEIIKFTGFTTNADGSVVLSGVSRNLLPQDPYTSTGTGSAQGAGTIVVFGNHPQVYESIYDYIDGIAVAGAPDASLTAKGLVEMATTAEINAGSSVGSTGAKLAMSPDQFTASTYGLNAPSSSQKDFLNGIVGMISPYAGLTAPTGFLLCDASTVSNNTYPLLLAVLKGRYGYGTATAFTADNATDFFTATSHGLVNGDIILIDNTGGALPTGTSINTLYYVVNKTTNTFQISTTAGGAAVNFTTNGTGTHSFYTQFKVPDLQARVPLGYASSIISATIVFDGASAVDPTTDIITLASNTITTGTPVSFSGTNLPVAEATTEIAFSLDASGNITATSGNFDHLQNGSQIRIKSLSGTAALTDEAIYYVINKSGGTFQVSTSLGGAQTGTGDAGTGTLVGMLSAVGTFYFISVSSTTAKIANTASDATAGTAMNITADGSGNVTLTTTRSAKSLGQTGGEEEHTLSIAEIPAHTHSVHSSAGVNGSSGHPSTTSGADASGSTGTTGGSIPHNNMPPYTVVNYIIKT